MNARDNASAWLSVILTLLLGWTRAEPAVHEFQAPHMGCVFTFKLVAEDAATGFALDEVTKLLKAEFHLENFLLDAGGQVAALGHPPGREAWGVAIEKLPMEAAAAATMVLKLRINIWRLREICISA